MDIRNKGFSIVELVIIILLISIVSIVTLPRLFNNSAFKSAGFQLDLLNALRYAQKTAIASGCDVQITISAASRTYALNYRSGGTNTSCGAGAFTDPVPHPQAQGSFIGTASNDVVLSNDLNVVFDSSGSPSSGGSLSLGSKVVTVEPVTGFVHD
jgi:type II secretory pathway pseudopilin PulG